MYVGQACYTTRVNFRASGIANVYMLTNQKGSVDFGDANRHANIISDEAEDIVRAHVFDTQGVQVRRRILQPIPDDHGQQSTHVG